MPSSRSYWCVPIRRLLRQGFTFLHRITASDRESEPDRYFNIRLKVVRHLQVTGVRTSLLRLPDAGCTRNRSSIIVYAREDKFTVFLDMSLSFMTWWTARNLGLNPPRNMARETARPAEYLMEYISGLSSRLRQRPHWLRTSSIWDSYYWRMNSCMKHVATCWIVQTSYKELQDLMYRSECFTS